MTRILVASIAALGLVAATLGVAHSAELQGPASAVRLCGDDDDDDAVRGLCGDDDDDDDAVRGLCGDDDDDDDAVALPRSG